VQQGQVFRLASRNGEGRWAYRYRVGGGGSRPVQRAGFASDHVTACPPPTSYGVVPSSCRSFPTDLRRSSGLSEIAMARPRSLPPTAGRVHLSIAARVGYVNRAPACERLRNHDEPRRSPTAAGSPTYSRCAEGTLPRTPISCSMASIAMSMCLRRSASRWGIPFRRSARRD